MPHEAELGLLAPPLAVEPRFRVGGRGVRIVRSPLAAEIRLPVAAARIGRRFVAILRLEAFHRRPSFDQRAVDREMIRAEQLLYPRRRQNRAQQLGGDVAFQQAFAVLGKCRVIPRRIVDANADEPAKQEVELEPIHQLPLRADRIERLQEHRSQQLLRRDRRPPHPRV